MPIPLHRLRQQQFHQRPSSQYPQHDDLVHKDRGRCPSGLLRRPSSHSGPCYPAKLLVAARVAEHFGATALVRRLFLPDVRARPTVASSSAAQAEVMQRISIIIALHTPVATPNPGHASDGLVYTGTVNPTATILRGDLAAAAVDGYLERGAASVVVLNDMLIPHATVVGKGIIYPLSSGDGERGECLRWLVFQEWLLQCMGARLCLRVLRWMQWTKIIPDAKHMKSGNTAWVLGLPSVLRNTERQQTRERILLAFLSLMAAFLSLFFAFGPVLPAFRVLVRRARFAARTLGIWPDLSVKTVNSFTCAGLVSVLLPCPFRKPDRTRVGPILHHQIITPSVRPSRVLRAVL
jgi:hypothetical protein